jgi:hypothetical protein
MRLLCEAGCPVRYVPCPLPWVSFVRFTFKALSAAAGSVLSTPASQWFLESRDKPTSQTVPNTRRQKWALDEPYREATMLTVELDHEELAFI